MLQLLHRWGEPQEGGRLVCSGHWIMIASACLIISACSIWDGDDDQEQDLVVVAQATLTAQATQPTATPTEMVPPQIPPTPTPSSADERIPNVFDIGWESAQLVSVVIALIDAYNAGEVEQVLSLLTDDANWADCDYEAGEAVTLEERDEIRAWLEERMANQDQLEVARMWNQNQSANDVLVTEWRLRQSDELRALGFEAGIEPEQGARVAFRWENERLLIRTIGTIGGPPCEIDAP